MFFWLMLLQPDAVAHQQRAADRTAASRPELQLKLGIKMKQSIAPSPNILPLVSGGRRYD